MTGSMTTRTTTASGKRKGATDQDLQEGRGEDRPHAPAASTWRSTHQYARRQRDGPHGASPCLGTAAPTPWTFNLTESDGTDTAGQPKGKRRFGETARRVQKPWPSVEGAGGLAEQERAALRAEIESKDAQIANLQASLNKLQAMMEAMMGAMAANGLLNTATPPGGALQQRAQANQQQAVGTAAAESVVAASGSQQGMHARPSWHETTEMEEEVEEQTSVGSQL